MSPTQARGTSSPFDATQATIIEALPMIVWAVGADGQVAYLNAATREYTGLHHAADFERAVHPDDLSALRERCMAAVRRGEQHDGRYRLRRAVDDASRWHTVRVLPMRDTDGTIAYALGIAVDDHERHTLVQANQALLASEQRAWRAVEDTARMEDEFLAALGHELRTPLNAIAGWTSLLKRGISGAEAARAIEVIERNSQVQRDLIGRMLDASRILSGHVRLNTQVIFLEDEVALGVESIRPEAEARGLSIRIEHRLPPQMAVNGDPARLQQVLGHVLDNAVRFTPHGGEILVRLWHQAGFVHLAVSDTGSGIPPALLPVRLRTLSRRRRRGAHRHGGLGLGLSHRPAVGADARRTGARPTSDGPGQGATGHHRAARSSRQTAEDEVTCRQRGLQVAEDATHPAGPVHPGDRGRPGFSRDAQRPPRERRRSVGRRSLGR